MSTASSTITIIMGIKRSHRRTKPGTGRRLLVRDAGLRPAPHHEAEQAPARSPLIPRSRAKRGVLKDEAIDAGNLNASALYRLMAWLSPAYPIGAFSYSSGMEWAVEAGDITDAASLERWLAVMIADGSGFCDVVFFVYAHRAVEQSDDGALRAVAELAAAFAPSKERHLETTAQGRAFLDTTGHGIALAPALQAYLQALAANLVSAGVRLVPLGQTDGQRVLAALEPLVAATAERALATALDDVGGAAFRADLASMRHETQHTRLFRS